jgi:tetratricopeptide (TPR) repeat protein
MKRGLLFALVMLAPAVAQAQTRPSSSSQTNSAELYLDRARRSNRDDEKRDLVQKALEHSLAAIKAKADNPKGYLLAGRTYALLGDALAADSMFDRAEQLWPDYTKETETDRIQLWIRAYNAGIVAARDNNQDEALKHFENATHIFDKRPGAHLNIAQIYARKQDNEKAINAYRTALQIIAKPENRQGLKPEEVKQWSELEETATFNIAQLLATTGKNEDALRAYQEFIARNPNNSMANLNLAVVLTRMDRTAEAAKVYNELLAMDLSDIDFFNVGVGLYKANQHAQAAEAFRKTIAKNPYMRDAHYNLAQAVYGLATELEEQKMKTTGAAVKPIDDKLIAYYQEIGELAEKLRGIDPANRNLLALQTRAYRGLSDLHSDVAVQTEWKNKLLAALTANDAMTFMVENLTLTSGAGEVSLSGGIVNLKATVGQPAKIRVHFIARDGSTIESQDVTVSLPEVQGATPFKATIKTDKPVAGWKYEVIA